MNAFVFVFFAALAAVNAGVLQGPSTKTTVVGPDGSAITSVAPGGSIVHEEHAGVVAHAAPLVAAPVVAAYSASPVVAHSAPLVAAHGVADTVISGPSGTIATSKHAAAPVVAAPVVTAHAAPVVAAHAVPVVAAHAAPIVAAHATPYVAAPVVAHAAPLVAGHAVYAGHHGIFY